MNLEQVLSQLQLTDFADVLRPGWVGSQQARPAGGLPFLAPDFIRQAVRDVYLEAEVADAAIPAARRIADNEALSALAWHLRYHLYVTGAVGWEQLARWPTLEASLDTEAGLFYFLVLLSGTPLMQEEHRKHAIPEPVVRHTLADLTLWLGGPEARRLGHAHLGLTPINVAWLSNHFRGNLYRLVRLQFQFAPFHARLRVFRHRETKAVLALSEAGVRFTPDGQVDQSRRAEGAWVTTLEMSEQEATGYPISPAGYAVPKLVTLPASEWQQVLAPGDAVLNLHIPSGGPMSHDLCGDSFRMAMRFFPEHYPDYHYRAFACGSWILNTWLEALLPPGANLLRFQREVYLYPIALWPPTMIERVFGQLPEDLSQAPRDTHLRRAILEVLEAGRELEVGGGGCFLFPEDFRWGEEVYRNQRLPAALSWMRGRGKESHGSRAGVV